MQVPSPSTSFWTIARDESLADVVTRGTARATAERDWTVHVDVGGLSPNTRYWYSFAALDVASPVGRTKTLPTGHVERLRMAMVSCAKFNAGFFNAYGRIAARDDLDFVLHLGDYIYEASQTPPKSQTPGADIGRPFEPRNECVTLEDYRTRYSQYHRDPDTRAMAPDASPDCDARRPRAGRRRLAGRLDRASGRPRWTVGKPAAAAFRARWEWLPRAPADPNDPERVYRSVAVATSSTSSSSTPDRAAMSGCGGVDVGSARTQLGHEQREWLLASFDESKAHWRISATALSSATSGTKRWPGRRIGRWQWSSSSGPTATDRTSDQWDGYPAERKTILEHLRDRP